MKCVCCEKAEGTEQVWNGDMWCSQCLREALAENDAMCKTLAENEKFYE